MWYFVVAVIKFFPALLLEAVENRFQETVQII